MYATSKSYHIKNNDDYKSRSNCTVRAIDKDDLDNIINIDIVYN